MQRMNERYATHYSKEQSSAAAANRIGVFYSAFKLFVFNISTAQPSEFHVKTKHVQLFTSRAHCLDQTTRPAAVKRL